MSDSEAMLHEANRRAHAVARASIGYLEARAGEINDRTRRTPSRTPAEWYAEQTKRYLCLSEAVDAYEEIQQRQQKEATL